MYLFQQHKGAPSYSEWRAIFQNAQHSQAGRSITMSIMWWRASRSR